MKKGMFWFLNLMQSSGVILYNYPALSELVITIRGYLGYRAIEDFIEKNNVSFLEHFKPKKIDYQVFIL